MKSTSIAVDSIAQPIPLSLSHLVVVNVKYKVLIYLGNTYYYTVSLVGFTIHVYRKHKVLKEV